MPDGVTGPVGVRKLTFAKFSYPTAESVAKFMTENKWEGYVVVDKGDHFEAAGEGVTDDMFTDVQRTLLAKDVFSFSGKVVSETTTTDAATVTAVTAAKSAGDGKERTVKYDDWDAWRADHTDLFATLGAGLANSPTPPGTWELNWAMIYTITNALKSGSATREQITKIASDFGGLVFDIYELLSSFTDTKLASAFVDLPTESAVKSALTAKTTTQKEAQVPEPNDNSTEAAKADNPVTTDTQGTTPAVKTEAPTPESTEVLSALANIAKSITDLTGTVTTLAGRVESVEKATTAAQEQVTNVAKAVEADRQRTPAGKAETSTDAPATKAADKDPAHKSLDDRFRANFMGG